MGSGEDDPSKDPRWGRNSPVLQEEDARNLRRPRPPNVDKQIIERQKAAGLGSRARQPRQRPYVENAKERKHLPPPLYPATSGHGAGNNFNSSFSNTSDQLRLPVIRSNASAMEWQSHDFLVENGEYAEAAVAYRKTWAKDVDRSTITLTESAQHYLR